MSDDSPAIPTAKSGVSALGDYLKNVGQTAVHDGLNEVLGNGMASSAISGKSSSTPSTNGIQSTGSPQQYNMQNPQQITGESVTGAINQMNTQHMGAFSTLNKTTAEAVKQNAIVVQSMNRLVGISTNMSSKLDKTNSLLEDMYDYFDKSSYEKSGNGGSAVSTGMEYKKVETLSPLLDSIKGIAGHLIEGLEIAGGAGVALKGIKGRLVSSVSKASPSIASKALGGIKNGLIGGAVYGAGSYVIDKLGDAQRSMMNGGDGGRAAKSKEFEQLFAKQNSVIGQLFSFSKKDKERLDGLQAELSGKNSTKQEITSNQKQISSENKDLSTYNITTKELIIKSDIIKFNAGSIEFNASARVGGSSDAVNDGSTNQGGAQNGGPNQSGTPGSDTGGGGRSPGQGGGYGGGGRSPGQGGGYGGGERSPGQGGGGRSPGGGGSDAPGISAKGSLAKHQQEAYKAARESGLDDVSSRALVANLSGESLRNPADTHRDPSRSNPNQVAHGIASWDGPRSNRIAQNFSHGVMPQNMSVQDQVKSLIWEAKTYPKEFPGVYDSLMNPNLTAEQKIRSLIHNYEKSGNQAGDQRTREGLYKGFKPEKTDPNTPQEQGSPNSKPTPDFSGKREENAAKRSGQENPNVNPPQEIASRGELLDKIKKKNPNLTPGQCVDLAKQITGTENVPTSQWLRGADNAEHHRGTAMATFMNRDGSQSMRYDGGRGGAPGNNTTHAVVYDSDIVKDGKVVGANVYEQYKGRNAQGPHPTQYYSGDKRGGDHDWDNYKSIIDARTGRPLGEHITPKQYHEMHPQGGQPPIVQPPIVQPPIRSPDIASQTQKTQEAKAALPTFAQQPLSSITHHHHEDKHKDPDPSKNKPDHNGNKAITDRFKAYYA